MTALMKAVHDNDEGRAKALIAGGADVNELDPNGDAPLVMAAYLGHADIVRALLEAGADVRAVDPGMRATALHAAAYAGRTEAARLLIAGGIDVNKQGPENGYTRPEISQLAGKNTPRASRSDGNCDENPLHDPIDTGPDTRREGGERG